MSDLLVAIEEGQPDVVILNEWIHSIDILSAVEQIRQLRPKMLGRFSERLGIGPPPLK